MAKSIADKIWERIQRRSGGSIFTPKDFTDLASHETARQTLSRLVEAGMIRRLMRGVYEYPTFSALLGVPASPDPDAIARAIARAHGWTILASGETALNLLGLSLQVPAQWQYLTDGPSKTYAWEGGTLAFKRRANKESTKLSTKTALIVQGLKALGRERIDAEVIKKLRASTGEKDRALALKEARYATAWVYEIIKLLAHEGSDSHA